MKWFAAILPLFLLDTQTSRSQSPFQFFDAQEYGQRQGLSVDETIFHISTDKQGYIWISSGNGLFRFNGTLFKSFPVKKDVPGLIPGREVRFFIQDKKGRYFTLITGSGLYEYKDTTGSFIPIRLKGDSLNLAPFMMGSPYIDDENFLWFSIYGRGLIRVNTGNYSYRLFDLKDPVAGYNYRSTSWVINMTPARQGGYWLSTNNGILHFDAHTGATKYHSFRQPYPQLEHAASGLYEDTDGSLWLGTWGHGLVHLFPATGKTEHHFINPGKISNTENILHSVLPRNAHELWIGSRECMFIFNKQTQQFSRLADRDYEVNGQFVFGEKAKSKLLNGYYLMDDGRQNLWAFTEKTLTQVKLSGGTFPYTFMPFGQVANKWAFGVLKVIPHPRLKDQYICATQFGNGLYLFDAALQKSIVLSGANGPAGPCEVNDILLHEGKLWVCTSQGLFLYDIAAGKYIPLPFRELQQETAHGYIYCIAINSSGIWLGGIGRLIYCNTRTGATGIFKDNRGRSLPEEDVLALFSDKDQNTWIGLSGGKNIACIQKSSGNIIEYAGNKNIFIGNGETITQTPNGTLFFCNRVNGLYRVEHPLTPQEKITRYTKAEGLPGDRIYAAFSDSDGYLWLCCSNGLSICDTRTMQFSNFDRRNGLPHDDLNALCTQASPGNIILPLKYGFTVINRDSLLRHTEKAIPVSIQKFTVNGKPYTQNISYFNRQTFKYYENSFSVDFSALTFDDAAGIEYYYILKGLSKDTVQVTGRTNITLYSLPPGKYVLQIRLKERNRPLQREGFDLYFTIRPPFWKTWWFIALCVLAVAFLLYRFYRYRINQILRLQQVRNTIAQDLHDDVGSTMTTISILSDVAKQKISNSEEPGTIMNEIGSQSRGLLDKLDDIVWSVNPKNDSLQQMTFRMKQVAIDLLGNQGVKVDFEVPDQLDNIFLPMQKRRNFYLIYKEALHNIAKYAAAKNVQVQVNKAGKTLHMTIADDGKGFNMQEQPPGNGLGNMQQRAVQSGGQCTISSEPGKGTTVVLNMPV